MKPLIDSDYVYDYEGNSAPWGAILAPFLGLYNESYSPSAGGCTATLLPLGLYNPSQGGCTVQYILYVV